MPTLSPKRLFQNRLAKRTYKHGNWRQTVVDCGGMCIWKEDGYPCCSLDELEFHAPFGEKELGFGNFCIRVLLCKHHHADAHPNSNDDYVYARYSTHKLLDDVQIEIWVHGGYNQWLKDFGLIDRFGYLLGGS